MATQNPRLALTIPPEVKKIYEETAKTLGIPASRLIVQIMIEASPSIKQMGESLQKAKDDPEKGFSGLAEVLQSADKASAEIQLDIEDQIKKQKKAKGTPAK